MGVSTDAYLFFGFEFHNPDASGKAPPFNVEEWEEEYAKACGIEDKSGLFDEEGEYAFEEGTKEFEAADRIRDAYILARDRAIAHSGCVINWHGSGPAPVYFVTLEKHFLCASRGHSELVDTKKLQVDEAERKQLIEFCKRLKIPYQEPAWRLASYWG